MFHSFKIKCDSLVSVFTVSIVYCLYNQILGAFVTTCKGRAVDTQAASIIEGFSQSMTVWLTSVFLLYLFSFFLPHFNCPMLHPIHQAGKMKINRGHSFPLLILNNRFYQATEHWPSLGGLWLDLSWTWLGGVTEKWCLPNLESMQGSLWVPGQDQQLSTNRI